MWDRIAFLIIGDGREEELARTVESSHAHIAHEFDVCYMHNDAAEDPAYGERLESKYSEFLVRNHVQRLGLSGSIQLAWHEISNAGIEYVFHLEEDFIFNKHIDIQRMISLIEQNNLAQLVLKRDSVNPHETSNGGWMESVDWEFTQRDGYVEQDHLFILNPCIYPISTVDRGWPDGAGETEFTNHLHSLEPDAKFGILGKLDDPPLVTHIGSHRSQYWKL